MGIATSTPAPPAPPARTVSRRERHVTRASPTASFDEKFDALQIDNVFSNNVKHIICPLDDASRVDATATQQYVLELLKDSKNRLGLSALSTNNPNIILEKPSAILKDKQIFNVAIPHEGAPVKHLLQTVRAGITDIDLGDQPAQQWPMLDFRFLQRLSDRHHGQIQHQEL